MTIEPWKALLLILFEQIAIFVVLLLHTWGSAQEQDQEQETQSRIEARLVELNARFGELKAQLARRKKGKAGGPPASGHPPSAGGPPTESREPRADGPEGSQ